MEMKDVILKFLNDISKQIKDNQTAQGRTASGKTARSLDPEATDTTGILYGSISVNALETGRKGGKVPKEFQGIIRKWIDDKGIFQDESESGKNSIAFLIARKISESGTLLFRQGGNSGVLSRALTNDRLNIFEIAVLREYGREIQDEVLTTFGK